MLTDRHETPLSSRRVAPETLTVDLVQGDRHQAADHSFGFEALVRRRRLDRGSSALVNEEKGEVSPPLPDASRRHPRRPRTAGRSQAVAFFAAFLALLAVLVTVFFALATAGASPWSLAVIDSTPDFSVLASSSPVLVTTFSDSL